jgi:hypothetical protein
MPTDRRREVAVEPSRIVVELNREQFEALTGRAGCSVPEASCEPSRTHAPKRPMSGSWS